MAKRKRVVSKCEIDLTNVTWATVLLWMNLNDVKMMCIEYSGAGDSGSIDDFRLYKDESKVVSIDIDIPTQISNFAEDQILKETQADFNNDGSSGSIDVVNMKYELVMNGVHHEYYTESNDTDYNEHLLFSAEEEDRI